MSTLLSQRSRDVVFGYTRSFNNFIPSQIIDLCIQFFNVGEEFDTQKTGFLVEGANHTIAKSFSCLSRICVGRNIISPSAYIYYHWQLKICALQTITIGIFSGINHWYVRLHPSFLRSDLVLDVYVNFSANLLFVSPKLRSWNLRQSLPVSSSAEEFKLKISTNKASSGMVFEILSFHVAKINDTPLKLALSMSDENDVRLAQKLSCFEAAINANPKAFTHCDEYLCLLISQREFAKAYDFVVRYIKSRNIPLGHVADIIDAIYRDGLYEEAKKLFEVLDDESKSGSFIKDIYFIVGDIYYKIGDLEQAKKYYQLCLEHTKRKDLISFCSSRMALLHTVNEENEPKGDDIDKCIVLSKKAVEYEPNDPIEHSNLGYYYYLKGDYAQSYVHLKRSIDIEPNGGLVSGNMANLLYAMEKYDESIPYFEKSLKIEEDLKHPKVGPKCLENYANVLHLRQKYKKSNDLLDQLIGRNDFAQHPNKDVVYWTMSLNFEKMKNIKKAIQYVKKAQKIAAKDLYANKLKRLQYKGGR